MKITISYDFVYLPTYDRVRLDQALIGITNALNSVDYKDWEGRLHVTDKEGHALFWMTFTDDGHNWTTRKWPLTPRMTKSELVQTALKCVLTAEEHEAREKFLYNGKPVFGPHFDIDRLHELCEQPDHKGAR